MNVIHPVLAQSVAKQELQRPFSKALGENEHSKCTIKWLRKARMIPP